MALSFENFNRWISENNPNIKFPEKDTQEYERQKEEYDKGITQMWDDLQYIVCDLTKEEQDYYLSLPSEEDSDKWLHEHMARKNNSSHK